MRKWSFIAKSFVGAAALTMAIGCQEVDAPPPSSHSVQSVSAVAPSPTPPVEKIAVAPPVVATPPAPPAPVAPPVDEATLPPRALVAAARQALAAGELAHADRLAHLLVLRAPDRSTAWNTLGRVQLKQGKRKDAIASFQKAVELDPGSSYAENNLGLALLYDGQYDDAVDALEEATSMTPVESYMWNNLGMAYEHLDRLDDAREAYHQAEKLENGRAPENLARLKGVKSVVRTAKADVPEDEVAHGTPAMLDDGGVH
jgi:Flp pilus assembly protein TadD